MHNYENIIITDSCIQLLDSFKLSKRDIKSIVDNIISDY
jgi:hypothetical protein